MLGFGTIKVNDEASHNSGTTLVEMLVIHGWTSFLDFDSLDITVFTHQIENDWRPSILFVYKSMCYAMETDLKVDKMTKKMVRNMQTRAKELPCIFLVVVSRMQLSH